MNKKTILVYCPNGCNSNEVSVNENDKSDVYDQCGSCGQIMRPDCEESFGDVYLAIEESGIAECERKLLITKNDAKTSK